MRSAIWSTRRSWSRTCSQSTKRKERIKGLNIAYIGDGDNVANSLLLAAASGGANATIACPVGYEPNAKITAQAKAIAKKTGSRLGIVHNPEEAASAQTCFIPMYG